MPGRPVSQIVLLKFLLRLLFEIVSVNESAAVTMPYMTCFAVLVGGEISLTRGNLA